jgi:hypothetical protein
LGYLKENDSLFLDWSTLPKDTKIKRSIIEEEIKSDSISSKLNDIDYISRSFSLTNFDGKEFGDVLLYMTTLFI